MRILLLFSVMLTMRTGFAHALRRSILARKPTHSLCRAASDSKIISETDGAVGDLIKAIKSTGDEIRKLKVEKSDANTQITKLLELKVTYEKLTGSAYDAKPLSKTPKVTKGAEKTAAKAVEVQGESLLITPRLVDYSAWYIPIDFCFKSQVIVK